MDTLPPWLTPLPDAETMREVDRWAIEEQGVDGLELMERAGAAVVVAVEQLSSDGAVTGPCGKGSNGGDGLVVARLLRQGGRSVQVVSVSAPSEMAGDARVNLERLQGAPPLRIDGSSWAGPAGDRPPRLDPALLSQATVIVDALLGTGFQGELRDELAVLVAAINDGDVPIVSVDVASGVDASSGAVRGAAVRAEVTVSFHAAKPGHWINPGKACTGTLRLAPIGIPRGAPMVAAVGLIGEAALELLPRRGASSTKFVSGHVLVVGGSAGLTGAPAMASHAAMRAGAGYVTALVPHSLQPVIAAAATPELMSRGLAEQDGTLSEDALEEVARASERGGALALGPGLGRSEGAGAFARRLARESRLPIVLDADGLNAHAGRLHELGGRRAATVLTPHAGELGRLLELESAEIERYRLRYVRQAAALSGAVVVLKGDDTLIAGPSGRVAVSTGGSPALATAGTGDVLTGVIAALLSQKLEPFAAAAAGVLMHARAGRLAARLLGGPDGVIAGDVIEALPRARLRGRAGAETE